MGWRSYTVTHFKWCCLPLAALVGAGGDGADEGDGQPQATHDQIAPQPRAGRDDLAVLFDGLNMTGGARPEDLRVLGRHRPAVSEDGFHQVKRSFGLTRSRCVHHYLALDEDSDSALCAW